MSLFNKIFGGGSAAPPGFNEPAPGTIPPRITGISLKKRTHVYFLLDESGSMAGAQGNTINGFNAYLDELRQDKGDEVLFTFVKFSMGSRKVYVQADPKLSPKLTMATYIPSGGTALLDAIGAIVTETEETINASDKVIFVIMTDGEENSSTRWSQIKVKNLIEKKQDAGWQFVFLGADIDAYKVGEFYGFKADSIAQYSKINTVGAMGAMAGATSCLRSAYVSGKDTSAPILSAEVKLKIEG